MTLGQVSGRSCSQVDLHGIVGRRLGTVRDRTIQVEHGGRGDVVMQRQVAAT